MFPLRRTFWWLAQVLLAFVTKGAAQYTPLTPPTGAVSNGVWNGYVIYGSWSGVFNNTVAFPTAYSTQNSGNIGTTNGIFAKSVQAANAYEAHPACTGQGCTCPYTASLAQNTTSYSCFILMAGVHYFQMQAVVTSGMQNIATVVLQPWASSSQVSSSSTDVSASAAVTDMVSAVKTAAYDFGSGTLRWCLTNQASNSSDPGFMANTSAFGAAANKVGITASNFSTCLAGYSNDSSGCSTEPYGACTQVNGSSPYDQFSIFRRQLWVSQIPLDSSWSCRFLFNGMLEPGSLVFGTQYSCNYSTAVLLLQVHANATALPLTNGYSAINLVSASPAYWSPGSLTGSLQIQLQNTGNVTGRFTVAVDSCSNGTNVTGALSVTQLTRVGQTLNFPFTISTNKSGGSGSCSFGVSGFGLDVQPGVTITYAATPYSPPPLPPPPARPPPPPASIYPYLNASINFSGSGIYDDAFISRYKTAIATSAKVPTANVLIISTVYTGRRLLQNSYTVNMQVRFLPSFFSNAADEYQSLLGNNITAAFASDSSFYSSFGPANAIPGNFAEGFSMVVPSQPPPPPQLPSPPGTLRPPPPPLPPPPPPGVSCGFGIPDCGQHGHLAAPCSCVCDSGYATDVNQDFAAYKYCNITAEALASSQRNTIASPSPPPPPVTAAPASHPKGLAYYYWIVIILGLLAVALASLRLVGCCRTGQPEGSSKSGFLSRLWALMGRLVGQTAGKDGEGLKLGKQKSFENALFEEDEDGDDDDGSDAGGSTGTESKEPRLADRGAARPRKSFVQTVAAAASGLITQVQARGAKLRRSLIVSEPSMAASEVALMPTRSLLDQSINSQGSDPLKAGPASAEQNAAFFSPLARGALEGAASELLTSANSLQQQGKATIQTESKRGIEPQRSLTAVRGAVSDKQQQPTRASQNPNFAAQFMPVLRPPFQGPTARMQGPEAAPRPDAEPQRARDVPGREQPGVPGGALPVRAPLYPVLSMPPGSGSRQADWPSMMVNTSAQAMPRLQPDAGRPRPGQQQPRPNAPGAPMRPMGPRTGPEASTTSSAPLQAMPQMLRGGAEVGGANERQQSSGVGPRPAGMPEDQRHRREEAESSGTRVTEAASQQMQRALMRSGQAAQNN